MPRITILAVLAAIAGVVSVSVWFKRRRTKMLTLEFGAIRIFRPTQGSEDKFRRNSENHLRRKYAPAVHTQSAKINEILQYHLAFFEKQIDKALQKVLSRTFIELILFQYDQYYRIHKLASQADLSPPEVIAWRTIAPTYGRAIKFMLERSAMIGIRKNVDFDEDVFTQRCDALLICAESVINMSIESDKTYHLFPDTSEIEVCPPGEDVFLRLQISDQDLRNKALSFPDRVRADRERTLGGPLMNLQNDPQQMDQYLGAAFTAALGLTFEEVINLFLTMRLNIHPASIGFPTYFMEKSQLLEWLAEIYTQLSQDQLNTILSGFLVDSAGIAADGGRAYWNPKAEHRAFRRGLIQIPQRNGEAIVWSRSMFDECLQQLIQSMSYGDVPEEWRLGNIPSAIGDLTRELGAWFEVLCQTELEKLGFNVVVSRTGIGQGAVRLNLLPQPGEIDLLAYLPAQHLLLVGECKRVIPGAEPKFYRNDISKFTVGPNSYVPTFRRKVQFVRDNVQAVTQALSHNTEMNIQVAPTRIVTVMITSQPTFASIVFDEFPCISLTELIADLTDSVQWPYVNGTFDI